MSNDSTGRASLVPIILLLVALSGWIAFAGAWFALSQARIEIQSLSSTISESEALFDKLQLEQGRIVKLLNQRIRELEARLEANNIEP